MSQLELDEIGSPSHAVRVKQDASRSARVALATATDVPNRDLVLDTRFKSIEPQVLSGRGKDGKGRFTAIVPSSSFGIVAEAYSVLDPDEPRATRVWDCFPRQTPLVWWLLIMRR